MNQRLLKPTFCQSPSPVNRQTLKSRIYRGHQIDEPCPPKENPGPLRRARRPQEIPCPAPPTVTRHAPAPAAATGPAPGPGAPWESTGARWEGPGECAGTIRLVRARPPTTLSMISHNVGYTHLAKIGNPLNTNNSRKITLPNTPQTPGFSPLESGALMAGGSRSMTRAGAGPSTVNCSDSPPRTSMT